MPSIGRIIRSWLRFKAEAFVDSEALGEVPVSCSVEAGLLKNDSIFAKPSEKRRVPVSDYTRASRSRCSKLKSSQHGDEDGRGRIRAKVSIPHVSW